MPARLVKPSICSSREIDALSCEAERLWLRLLTHTDDWGIYEADPVLVRANCFPRKLGTISEADVEAWLAELQRAGLTEHYAVGGRQYGRYVTFRAHNRTRAKRPKWPLPPGSTTTLVEAQHTHTHEDREIGSASVCVSDSDSVSDSVSGGESDPQKTVDQSCKHMTANVVTCQHMSADSAGDGKDATLAEIFLADYAELYSVQYSGAPTVTTGKCRAAAERLAQEYGRDEHRELCRAFLACDESTLQAAAHPYSWLPYRAAGLLNASAMSNAVQATQSVVLACPHCYSEECAAGTAPCDMPRAPEEFTAEQLATYRGQV